MANSSLTIKVPGKLMIAGEFAVLEPYHHLSVIAVDRFVYAKVGSSNQNYVTLENFGLSELAWEHTNDGITIHTDDERINFVKNAMEVTLTYLKEKRVQFDPFHLSIKSELDDVSGAKYGLGSSAAVVTSVVAAILHKFLPEDGLESTIFKLAAVSHVKTQGNGSGADVAASSFGGLLEYSSFQAEWLKHAYERSGSMSELLDQDWTYFSIKPIELPNDIYFCVGWTGKPASTKRLVDEILKLKADDRAKYDQFLADSTKAVGDFLRGMEKDNHSLLLDGIKQNRRALAMVGEHANVAIETPLLTKLCDLAEAFGGAGKPSGAGGGDCGIAFMPSREKAQALLEAWSKAGIKPLDLQPYLQGATVM